VVLSTLLAIVGGGEIFLDVPGINRDAVALAQDRGLVPVFDCAHVYPRDPAVAAGAGIRRHHL